MNDLSGNTFINGPEGNLEAILKEPEGDVTRAAIVCHPHPLFGGTMHNKVVYRIAKAFQQAGFVVLRFNFRGAGRSEGKHADGIGEQDDLRAAIQFIKERHPDAEIWVAGFSFGAAVLLRTVCKDARVNALIAVGTPASKYAFSDVETCQRPKLFVQGSLDEFGSKEDLQRFFERLQEPKEMQIIEGADHFFQGQLDELFRIVSQFIDGQPG